MKCWIITWQNIISIPPCEIKNFIFWIYDDDYVLKRHNFIIKTKKQYMLRYCQWHWNWNIHFHHTQISHLNSDYSTQRANEEQNNRTIFSRGNLIRIWNMGYVLSWHLRHRIWYCFDNYFTYFVPVFKYCYSDSRNLWTVMRAGGLAP